MESLDGSAPAATSAPPVPSGHPGASTGTVPNKQHLMIGMMVFLATLTITFVTWRLFVTVRLKRRLSISDFLITVGAGFNVTSNVVTILSSFKGQGYHYYDPSVKPSDLVRNLRYIWLAQVSNVWSMVFVKSSIVAYLLLLNFSPTYRVIIWLTVPVIVISNFLFPTVCLFAGCTPISFRWNKQQQGSCWPGVVDSASGYQQSASNIVTDIIFSAAPLVYLSAVQLPRSTQWGLRAVFLCGLIGTGCSVAKLTQFKVLAGSDDPLWQSANLAIFSNTEVGITIFAACLPPLRSCFNDLLRRLFPSSAGSKARSNKAKTPYNGSYEMKRQPSTHPLTPDDGSSERSILPDNGEIQDKECIVKTVNVNVQDEKGLGFFDGRDYRDDFRAPAPRKSLAMSSTHSTNPPQL